MMASSPMFRAMVRREPDVEKEGVRSWAAKDDLCQAHLPPLVREGCLALGTARSPS